MGLLNLLLRRLILLMTIESLAWAQSPAAYSISGVVQDSSSAAIPAASITLTKAGEAGQRVAAADSTGAFRLDEVTAGNYEIEVRKEGFKLVDYQGPDWSEAARASYCCPVGGGVATGGDR